jgi:hypothetical protein
MQQRDQAGSGLVLNPAFQRDPRTDLACCAWQGLVDPCFQLALLLHRQPADAAFVAETRQTFDPVLLIQLVPGSDRVIVEKQHLGDSRTTHAIVKQHQGIGAPGQPMRGRAVTRQFDQIASGFRVQEVRANHGRSRIASGLDGKRLFRIPEESRYNAPGEQR